MPVPGESSGEDLFATVETVQVTTLQRVLQRSPRFAELFAMSPHICFILDGQARLLECHRDRGTLRFTSDGGEGELKVTLSSTQLHDLDRGAPLSEPLKMEVVGRGSDRTDRLLILLSHCLEPGDVPGPTSAQLLAETSEALRPQAASVAVTLFLSFGLLWLILAAAGLSGMPLAHGAAMTCLLRGGLAVGVALLLAARVAVAPTIATIGFVLIWICPSALGGLERAVEQRAATRQVDETLVARLSVPPWQRPVGPDPAVILQQAGYIEAPAISRLVHERRDHLERWVNGNPNTVYSIRADLFSRFHQPELEPDRTPASIFNQRLLEDIGRMQGGADWVWFDSFMTQARQQGLNDPPVLTAQEAQESQEYVRQWLRTNPDAEQQFAMAMGGVPEKSPGVDEVNHTGLSVLVFMLLAGVGAAWLGRTSFRRPFDLARLPGWTLASLRRHVRTDGSAAVRLVAGLACTVGGILLMAMVMAFHRHFFARMAFCSVTLGVCLIASALVIPTDDEIEAAGG